VSQERDQPERPAFEPWPTPQPPAGWPPGDGQGLPGERPAWLDPAGPMPAPPQRGRRTARNPLPPLPASKRAVWLELGLVMLLAFAPAALILVLNFAASAEPSTEPSIAQSVVASLLTVFLTWSPLLVLAFLMMRNRERPATIGLTRFTWRDLGAGIGLCVVSYLLVVVLSLIFAGLGSNDVEFLPDGLPLWFLGLQALVISISAGVTEEVVVRGYAQTRLEQLGLPTWLVVVLPTALWSPFHIYQGLAAVVTIFGLGLFWALWFQRTRRLWPLIVAHALFDLFQLVLLLASRSS
jgi:membrane protease YdiL (CAAX protease family)